MQSNPQDSSDILAALTGVPAASPYGLARFRAAQWLIHDKRETEAVPLLDAALKPPTDPSTQNALHAERMELARNFEEFSQNAPRKIDLISDGDSSADDHPPTATTHQ